MNWFKAFAILFCSVIFSLHAKANNGSIFDPSTVVKDSLKVEQKIKFNPLMLFSLPKAVDPVEHKGATKKEEKKDIGAI